MITKIGIVAGEIWHYLDSNGMVKLSALTASIEHDQEVVLMSLGWLAREGHVVVNQDNGDYVISLRKECSIL